MSAKFSTRFRLIFALFASALIIALALPHIATFAQGSEPTGIVDAAYRDLSAKLGKPIARGGDSTFSWEQASYPDSSLGCPQPGKAYSQIVTPGYKISISYGGTIYDYRATLDGSVLFQCAATGGAPLPAITPVPNTGGGASGAPGNVMSSPLAFVNLDGNLSLIPAGEFSYVPLTSDSVRQAGQSSTFYGTSHAYDQPKWNADGSKVAFTDISNSAAYVALSGLPTVQIAAGLSTAFPISWNTDGNKVYYAVSTQEQKDNGVVQQVQAISITPANKSAPEFAGSFVESVGCGGGGPIDPGDAELMRETGFGGSHMTLEWTPKGFVHTTTCSGSGLALTAPSGQVLWTIPDVSRARVSPDRSRVLAVKGVSFNQPNAVTSLVMIDVATGAVTPVQTQANPDQAAWSPDAQTIYYSTLVPASTVQGNAASALGKQIFPELWPLNTQDYTATLWRVPTAGGQSQQLWQRTGRAIGVISPALDNSGAAISFIPSSRAMVEAINRNAAQNEVVAQAPVPMIFFIKADGSSQAANPQQLVGGRQPAFGGPTAFKPRAADGGAATGGQGQTAPAGNVGAPALVVGGKAIVITTRGDTLNVRQTASRSAPVLRILKPGAVVDIVGGPQSADGFRWWQVRADDGSTGWVVDQVTDNDGTTNTLQPQ